MEKTKSYYEKLDKRSKEFRDWKANQIEVKEPRKFVTNHSKEKVMGYGDVVEKILDTPGIKQVAWIAKKAFFKEGEDCGCDDRKKKWNSAGTFPIKLNPRCFTEEEFDFWTDYRKRRTLNVSGEDVKLICKLYSDVFNTLYWEPCAGCSARRLINVIDRLDKIYETYIDDTPVRK